MRLYTFKKGPEVIVDRNVIVSEIYCDPSHPLAARSLPGSASPSVLPAPRSIISCEAPCNPYYLTRTLLHLIGKSLTIYRYLRGGEIPKGAREDLRCHLDAVTPDSDARVKEAIRATVNSGASFKSRSLRITSCVVLSFELYSDRECPAWTRLKAG